METNQQFNRLLSTKKFVSCTDNHKDSVGSSKGVTVMKTAKHMVLIVLFISIFVSLVLVAPAQGPTIEIITYDLTTQSLTTSYVSAIQPVVDETFTNSYVGSDPAGTPEPGEAGRNFPDTNDNDTGNSSNDSENKIIGNDDRKLVTRTTSFPARAICRIESTFPDGKTTVGTGTMASNRYLITAGHVVFNTMHMGYASTIKVFPGQNGTLKPYGTVNCISYKTFGRYINNGDDGYDMAVLKLDQPIGNRTGFLGLVYYSNIVGHTGNLWGYPLDKDGDARFLYHALGGTTQVDTGNHLLVDHNIDAAAGQSGAALYAYNSTNGSRRIFAVHKGAGGPGTNFNVAVYLDTQKYNVVSSWVQNGF